MQIIFFDIDETLFNTDVFKKNFKNKVLSVFKISDTQFDVIAGHYLTTLNSRTDFNPTVLLRKIAQAYHFDGNTNEVLKSSAVFNHCIFVDAIKTLQKLQTTYSLGIYSEGLQEFQRLKLEKTGILHFFGEKNIHIQRRKKLSDALSILPINSFVIDDKTEVLDEAKKHKLLPVWINRKSKVDHPLIRTIHTLTDLPSGLEPIK